MLCRGDIIRIRNSSYEPLIYGQSADCCGLAWHPKHHHHYITVANSGHVCYWNAELRQLIAKCCMGPGIVSKAVAISPKGEHVAIGCGDGSLRVLQLDCSPNLPLSSEARDLSISKKNTFLLRSGRCATRR
jgi:WD40 repeat protein